MEIYYGMLLIAVSADLALADVIDLTSELIGFSLQLLLLLLDPAIVLCYLYQPQIHS